MSKTAKSINVEIGTRIKARRLALGLTRDRLAQASGYSTAFIQQVERGYSGLSSESIRAFSMALNTSTDSILFGNATDSFEYVVEKLKAVPTDKQECLMRLIDDAIECVK